MIRKTALNRPDFRHLALFGTLLLLAAVALIATPARAQEFDPVELEDLVAPIALYPDDVLGIILPASTFPLDVVRAARFIEELEANPALQPDEAWDDSIVALLNYPEVVRMMNEDLDWTWALGEAVLTDQTAVLVAAQNFRSRAYAAGNLRSDDKQTVVYTTEAIEIKPADPKVVYIPVYEPREVIVYQTRPVYRYYPIGYPLYYYPYPIGYSFGRGYFWGVTSYFNVGWDSHYVHVHHHTDRFHPYYLNSYYLYTPYYPRRNVNISVTVDSYRNVWQPSPRRGVRPRTVTVESRSGNTRRPSTTTVERQPNLATGSRTVTRSQQRAPAQSTQRGTTTLGGVAERPAARSTTRNEATRPNITASNTTGSNATSSATVSSPTQSTRTRQAAPTTTTRSSTTRQSTTNLSTTRQPARQPQAAAPSNSAARSTQGSTRRAEAPTRSSSPQTRSSGQRSGGAVSQSTRRSNPAPRSQEPSRTRQR